MHQLITTQKTKDICYDHSHSQAALKAPMKL